MVLISKGAVVELPSSVLDKLGYSSVAVKYVFEKTGLPVKLKARNVIVTFVNDKPRFYKISDADLLKMIENQSICLEYVKDMDDVEEIEKTFEACMSKVQNKPFNL